MRPITLVAVLAALAALPVEGAAAASVEPDAATSDASTSEASKPEAGKPGTAGLVIESAAIEGGRLVVSGTSARGGVPIRIDGTRFKTKAKKDKSFALEAVFVPPDCVVTLMVKNRKQPVAVANCGPEGPAGVAGPRGLTGPQGPRGPVGDPGAGIRMAKVDGAGTLVSHVGAVSAERIDTGRYTVVFAPFDPTCGAVATMNYVFGNTSTIVLIPQANHRFEVDPRMLVSGSWTAVDSPFTVMLVCPA